MKNWYGIVYYCGLGVDYFNVVGIEAQPEMVGRKVKNNGQL